MGFFSAIADAAKGANEEAHGQRLLREYRDSIGKMGSMLPASSDEIIQRFVAKRAKLKVSMGNWTLDGILGMSKTLKDEARRVTDLNIIEGYALWMTSAWLESGVRTSENALQVFGQLDGLARAHESIADDSPTSSPQMTPTRQREGDEVLFDAIRKILRCLSIERTAAVHSQGTYLKMEELTPHEQLTLAAAIGGVAAAVSQEFGQELQNQFGLAAGLLELYGMSKPMAIQGMASGVQEYSPNPTTHFGITTWRGIEAMRRYRMGIDEDLNCSYIAAWLFDGEY